MKGINEVKKELRELKKHAHAIERLESIRTTHIKRIQMLERMEKTDKLNEIIRNERRLLEALPISEELSLAQELEEKYMGAIATLGPIEKSIVIDTYINGLPYWKIGVALGYSEEGIRKRLSKAIHTISAFINDAQ
ncbi:MAG: sigma-70 family RNA polymerase sigma factor [Clostridia bacterium]|nr:sigma-70 family RNA polymerase sigma factor [Clostridia bacterium]